METTQIDKQNRIIDAAREVFRRYGYAKTSIADIASEARLGKGTIYYYFDSKEDIFVEILRQQAETMSQSINALIDEVSDIRQKIRRFIIKPVEFLAMNAPLLLDVFSNANDDFLRKIQAFKAQFHDQALADFQGLIEQGQRENAIRPELDAKEVTKVLHSWMHYWMNNISCKKIELDLSFEGTQELLAEYNLLIDLIFNGLLVKEAK